MLLTVRELTKSFVDAQADAAFSARGERRALRAVDHVSFALRRGECFGLVGESGCGKSTVSKLISRAITADSGSVIFNERRRRVDVLSLRRA